MTRRGIVHLVGAGPGDPELITVKGLRCLTQADVVVHDRLAARALLDHVPEHARRIDVGKSAGHHPWPQSRINTLLIAEARRQRRVVRLKGGDPFVFGRGGEECRALAEAGIPFEIVPGVTSAIAVPAYAGIPVTDRACSSAFTVVTGHSADEQDSSLDWNALARVGTLVILMGLGRLERIAALLQAHGRPDSTPAAVICCGASARQVVVRGTLADIAERAHGLSPPATIVVGQVVGLSDHLAWFEASTSARSLYPAEEEIEGTSAGEDLRKDIVA